MANAGGAHGLAVLFLPGLGQGPQAWDGVIDHLNQAEPVEALRPDLMTELKRHDWSIDKVADALARHLDAPVDVVGLSLGAMVALALAKNHPQLVRSLFLSAPQIQPSRFLMGIQKTIMRALPARMVTPPGLTKDELFNLLHRVTDANLATGLGNIRVPVTVACGLKDRVNLPAARATTQAIPHARLVTIPRAGHEWNTAMPEEFATHLRTHLDQS